MALTWGLLVCGAPCGCGVTSKTVPLLISGITLSCLLCTVIWALGSLSLLSGGHGYYLICQPLYDYPHYETLTELLDQGGIFYGDNGIFYPFGSQNDTIKVASVIKSCQRSQPVYKTFHLRQQFDLEKNLNHKKWEDLISLFENFTAAKSSVEILTPGLQLSLQILSANSAANLTTYRHQMSGPVTKRDLGSFADQLNTVGRQLTDPVSSRKVDTLAFSLRKIVHNEMQRLNDIRGRILYKITTLEVLLPPLNRQVNQSLSHLKTIQFFLDNQGWQVAERTRRQFIARIENYLDDLYNHASSKVSNEIGKCRPLWEIFHAIRFSVCKLIVDPLMALAFASFFLILLFIATTPAVIKLIEFYKESRDEDFFGSVSHRHARDGLIIDDEGTWASPSVESPEELAAEERISRTWVSPPPRPPTVSSRVQMPRIQVPTVRTNGSPRSRSKLSSLASRITGARNLQIPSVSRARTPRRGHESLRLIEPIHWKSGSTTPGSWI